MTDRRQDPVREALRRAGEGPEARIDGLLDAVPAMLSEAERRREAARADVLRATVPVARRAIPRLAAAATLLVAITAGVLLTGVGETTTSDDSTSTETLDAMLLRGNGVTDEWMLGSILDPTAVEND